MSQQYYLDVAYQSDISVVNAAKPISLAYGFVLQTGGTYQGLGEKVDQRVDAGDLVSFSVFDTASNPATITSVVITCKDVTNPKNPIITDPFGWVTPGTFTLLSPGLLPGGVSTGCNVKGHYLSVGNFAAQSQGQGKGQKKTYDITVTVNVIMPDGSTRIFQVDPDMDVEGVN